MALSEREGKRGENRERDTEREITQTMSSVKIVTQKKMTVRKVQVYK